MTTAEVNIAKYSSGVLEAQTNMEDLQKQHSNAVDAKDTKEANRLDEAIRKEASKMKRYELYTKFWGAASEIEFYFMGIGTSILKIKI